MDADVLGTAHEAYGRRAWALAHELLGRADAVAPLGADDLERLAVAAYMLGRDDEQIDALARAHRAHLRGGRRAGAVRAAFWLAVHLTIRGEAARATGWLRRARRLMAQEAGDCPERGYLASADALRCMASGDWAGTRLAASRAVEAGQRFGDPDLVALGLADLGRALVEEGSVVDGLEALDEAMVAATAGELTPVATGFVYCGVIEGCHAAFDLARAGEWTAALAGWCAQQPDLVPFTGTCLLHRAEILQVRGAWDEALAEAGTAARRFAERRDRRAAGEAWYRCGEVLRARGDVPGAERAFRQASRHGREPQPGLALLRLDQGRADVAWAAVRGALDAAGGWVERARLLPAYVDIALAAGDLDAASAASDELGEIAARNGRTMLRAAAEQARGAVELAGGRAREAAARLRRAAQMWLDLAAPYEAARARMLVAAACRATGDTETATLEDAAAREELARLGAVAGRERHGLTPRELQVLRRLATGESNTAIAARLGVSRRTVDRHVSNLYAKLRVSSRAAATAYAYEHELV
ncbi:LuxR C-terminal-related transcriptional regulator [Miltoncostaea marina]|uniref:LuxR C-terminal-related transcriptional regulator n=1 Tax=Miltoncostaea marina TaxID=2843215 RepID=UPI001C3E18F0|nr:LuxR C-terminal-related transcriptional regulator [Miltoncostaea marina]